MGRAAERPPLTRFRQHPLVRGLAVAALGAALEAGVSLAFRQGSIDDVGIATALAVLIAALAAFVGGPWAGLAVTAAGWTLQFFFVHDAATNTLAALPIWAAAAAAVAWLASRLQTEATDRDQLRDRLAVVEEATQHAVIELDADAKIVAWNDGAEDLYGYAAEEAVGREFAELAPGDDGEATQALLEAVGRGKRVSETSVRQRRKDGEVVRVAIAAAPIGRWSGHHAQALVVATDVGEAVRAKEQFAELEARYHSLVQLLPGSPYVHPAGERDVLVYASHQIGTMLGYRAEEWLAQRGLFSRLVHEEDRERVSEEIARAAAASTPFRSEYRMLARDGRVVWVRDHATTVRGQGGEPLCVQGYLVDVSAENEARAERERLRAEARGAAAEAAQRQRRIDVLTRASLALGTSFDRDAALRRIAELAVEGLADWCIVDLVNGHGNTARVAVARGDVHASVGAPDVEPEAPVLEVIESGEASLSERRICVPMAARGRTLGALTLLATNGGRSYGPDDLGLAELLGRLAALSVDNARLHQQVQESADAAHVLTYVADGVFLVDRAGVIRLWNPTVEAITGLEARAVVGREAADVIPDWQTLAGRIPVGGAEPVEPETLPMETEFGERWISISGVEFFGGTVYAFRDLTQARRLEQLKAEFVATASHELRTPLAAVYGAAQTLRRHDFALDEAGRERFVSLIVEESERLGRIVNDILLANQLDVGSLDLRTELFDPSELVERVADAARAHAPPAIALETAAEQPLPTIASDRERVRQVLVNLVENAIKYSPEGGRVEVGARPAGRMIRFYVRDEGLGIPADEQMRVFDKFYRLDPQMTGGIGGSGLGLYICNELVERMGGRIWVESDGESGSTFSFEIPATESVAARPVAQGLLDAPDG